MSYLGQKFIHSDIWHEVLKTNVTSGQFGDLPSHIKRLSDIYVSGQGSADIWQDQGLAEAYLSYFLPLNSVRLLHAWSLIDSAQLLSGTEHIYEYGSGPGTAQISLSECSKLPWTCNEKSPEAQKIHSELANKLGFSQPEFTEFQNVKENSLGVFSYVLTEAALPKWAYDCDSLFILEASMREASRNLMQLRQQLIDKGFSILAPCTHQKACPLLTHTNKDFCHFRVHFDPPEYFKKLEEKLPMKNRSLTYSFLVAKKIKAPTYKENIGRVLGEAIYEKGKIRQPFCRNEEREQLSWLRRGKEIQPPESGSLLELPDDVQKKGHEIRF